MGKRVVLVGCGNIGSYHLLSLCGVEEGCSVQVVEPYGGSVEVAKGRISDSGAEVEWLGDVSEVGGDSDLAVVATLATGRVDVIEQLLAKGHRRFLIEKVVCQSVVGKNGRIKNAGKE